MMWLVILVVCVIVGFVFLSVIFELGFRNQGNLDWMCYTEWVNEYFVKSGFVKNGYGNETSSHPFLSFKRDNSIVKVQLNAPLLIPPIFYTIDIIVDGKKKFHFSQSANKEDAYMKLDAYFKVVK